MFKDWKEEDILSVKAPVMILIGDADVIRPEHALEMFRLLPHAHLVILPGGHGEYLGLGPTAKKESDLPEFVVSMVGVFLDQAP